jgi:hypothetical protein
MAAQSLAAVLAGNPILYQGHQILAYPTGNLNHVQIPPFPAVCVFLPLPGNQ